MAEAYPSLLAYLSRPEFDCLASAVLHMHWLAELCHYAYVILSAESQYSRNIQDLKALIHDLLKDSILLTIPTTVPQTLKMLKVLARQVNANTRFYPRLHLSGGSRLHLPTASLTRREVLNTTLAPMISTLWPAISSTRSNR